MATFKIKNLNALRKTLDQKRLIILNKLLRDEKIRLAIGNIIKDDIQNRKFRTAKRSTQKTRKYLERFNKTHPKYSRPNINVTFTGELLEDLSKNVLANTTKGYYLIQHSTKKHKLYRTANGLSGYKRTRAVSYKQLSVYLRRDKNIEYLNITPLATKKIVSLIKKLLSKVLIAN